MVIFLNFGYFSNILLKLFNGHISEFTVKQDKVAKDLKSLYFSACKC